MNFQSFNFEEKYRLFFFSLLLIGFVAGKIALADTPIITSFVIPATFDSFTVPITAFTATGGGTHAVSGYLITETSIPPSLANPAWIPEAPVTYTFTSEGTKTLYAWVKDANGDISASLNASVIVATPDNVAPAMPGGLVLQ